MLSRQFGSNIQTQMAQASASSLFPAPKAIYSDLAQAKIYQKRKAMIVAALLANH